MFASTVTVNYKDYYKQENLFEVTGDSLVDFQRSCEDELIKVNRNGRASKIVISNNTEEFPIHHSYNNNVKMCASIKENAYYNRLLVLKFKDEFQVVLFASYQYLVFEGNNANVLFNDCKDKAPNVFKFSRSHFTHMKVSLIAIK